MGPELPVGRSLRSNARSEQGLHAVDESTLKHGITRLHFELEGPCEESIFPDSRSGFEQSHTLNQALPHDGIGSVEAERLCLRQPERLFDDLVLQSPSFVVARDSTDSGFEIGDGFDNFAATNVDPHSIRASRRRPKALDDKEAESDEDEMA
jgi:hypothetical protein